LHASVSSAVERALAAYHGEHPLREGADLSLARGAAAEAVEREGRPSDPGLIDAVLDDLAQRGVVARTASEIRLASHRVELAGRREDVDRLIKAVAGSEPSPPTVSELAAAGHSREVIDA